MLTWTSYGQYAFLVQRLSVYFGYWAVVTDGTAYCNGTSMGSASQTTWCRSIYSTLPPGTTSLIIPAKTLVSINTHLLIYSASSLMEQTTPTALSLADEISSISNLLFVDKAQPAVDFEGPDD